MLTHDPVNLDDILKTAIESLDIPPDVYERAVARYSAVGESLSDFWSADEGIISPQGSFLLGTVVQPINPGDHYDIDLVCRRELSEQDTSPSELKADVGRGLRSFVSVNQDGDPKLDPGCRCWTLTYAGERFHMDVLPAIPDARPGRSGSAIRITDRDVRGWLDSDPAGFAAWFARAAEPDRVALREVLAKRMQVDQVPERAIKTPLQLTVQALKRHRDLHFGGTKRRPASVVITTLAAHAYVPGASVSDALVGVTERMPAFVEKRDGKFWIPNPVNEQENFADRWELGDAETLFQWLDKAHRDFLGYGTERGVDKVLTKVASSLGESVGKSAAATLGAVVAGVSGAGALNSTPLGALVRRPERPAPAHTFHHGRSPRRAS